MAKGGVVVVGLVGEGYEMGGCDWWWSQEGDWREVGLGLGIGWWGLQRNGGGEWWM